MKSLLISILALLNNQRQSMIPKPKSMPLVTIDSSFNILQSFINTHPNCYIFNNRSKNATTWPGFTLTHKLNLTSNFIIHDTYQKSILPIYRFRINQMKNCFDYNLCNKTHYNSYKSCIKPSGYNCDDAHDYVPLISDTLRTLTNILVDCKGPYSPKWQNYSFWAYGQINLTRINDLPYKC